MAESVATELVKVVFQKLADEAFMRIVRSQGIYEELNELESTLSRIQDLLDDASHKEVTDKSVKQWLTSLQHLAYDIDDVLDDVATEAMHREPTSESGASTSLVRKLVPTCCTNFSLSHRLLPKLDGITTKLRRLEKQNPGLTVKGEKPKSTSRGNETSLPDASSVVGREVEKEKFLNMLLRGESSKEKFSILPIVGMGGVGKTTLARLLYNNTKVNDHFELKAWVCVSDEFDVIKISDTILQDVTKEKREFKDLNQLQKALTEQFKEKRFLLVLDGVWHENADDWENLVRPFHSCASGSRIIMTTRKEQLLKKLGFKYLDRLESLSHEDALCLFSLHALGVDNFDSHTTLKLHGEDIVKKCACLPLAIKAIGRLLRTKTCVEDWDDVLNSPIWDIENGNEIVPALRLSYHDLSANLKQLFAYCSLFPKDFLFDKEELVLLWMAEGFLNPSNPIKSPERLGHEYFEILLSRSFFQHAPNEKSLYVMHDLMVDLSTFIAGEFFLRFENHMKIGKEDFEKHRYMSFTREKYVGYHKLEPLKRARSLRTLLAVFVGVEQDGDSFYLPNKILGDLLPELPMLRVLCLSHFEITEVPDFIGCLKHLRYLNLSRTMIKELPDNVGNLYNLQTLILLGCRKLSKLPKSFLKLKKLRHFDLRGTPLLEKLPLGTDELKSLYTLTKIIIGGDDGFAITKLKGFKNLHGIVSIEGLHNVQSVMHVRGANVSLKEVTNLWLNCDDASRRGSFEKEVLNELEPNREKLKVLTIMSYGGTEFSSWVGNPYFHELVEVWIYGCRKCTYLPPFGQLPSLKKLCIQGIDEVKVIGLELTGAIGVAFPSLEFLQFRDISGWEAWSTSSKDLNAAFPSLQELHIHDCPKLIYVYVEALPLLKVLDIDGCSDGMLRSLVQVASSITELNIKNISGLTDEVWRGVIKYLGAVEEVSIWSCNEIRYLWESEAEASKALTNLKKLTVCFCSELVSLEEIEAKDNFESSLLSSFRMLVLESCDSMQRCCCPNSIGIESLWISFCNSLTRVSFPTTGGGQKLKSLTICSCMKLMEKINNTSMPMLETVLISSWTNLTSITHLSNFSHLTELIIHYCPSIKSFHDLQLLNLTRLSIQDCKGVESFFVLLLPNLTSLRDLEIRDCRSIDASVLRGLWPPKLCSLEIARLKKPISDWGAQNFPTSLVDLTLSHEKHVSSFSKLSNFLPSSITTLAIYTFDKLESLSTGLEHLTSLQHLTICHCPKMKYLPETVLPSLLSLRIYNSPNLKERCNGRGSHYWPLISHIPCIEID